MPEQQRRGKFFRDDAAIHRHKGHQAAVALLVYPAGDGLLARTVGAEDKHGHLHRGDQCGHAFYLTCRRAAKPEQGFPALRQRQRGTQQLTHGVEQTLRIYGLGQIIVRTRLHGTHRVRVVRIPRHYHKGHVTVPAVQPLQQRQPVAFGQAHVSQNQVKARLADEPAGGRLVDGCLHRIPAPFQTVAQTL